MVTNEHIASLATADTLQAFKEHCKKKTALVASVSSQCLPCGNQRMCTQVQPN